MSGLDRKTIQNASEVQVNLNWCLLATEIQGFSFQSTATERELSILTRRALAYRAMRKDLAGTDDTLPSDNSILGLAVAISAEQRLGNLKAARFHCQAVKAFLFRRNGLQTLREISYPSGIMVLNCVIGLGLPGLYSDQDIRPKVDDLRRKVRAMQWWNESLWPLEHSRGPEGEGTRVEAITDVGLQKRMEAFSERPMFDYVSIPPRPLEEAEYRWFLPILYTLNSVLFAFRAHPGMASNYLDLLCDSVRLSENTDFICQCVGGRLPSLVLVIMLGHCAQKSQGGQEHSPANEVYAVEEILEFVELVMMASTGSRDLLLKAMWSWLTAVEYGDLFRPSGAKLDIFENEIVATWDQERASRVVD